MVGAGGVWCVVWVMVVVVVYEVCAFRFLGFERDYVALMHGADISAYGQGKLETEAVKQ